MNSRSRFSAAFFFFLLSVGSPFLQKAFAEGSRIVAVVNDEVITQADVDRAVGPIYLQMQATLSPEELAAKSKDIRIQILQQLIEERLMLQEAKNPKPVEFGKGKVGTPSAITVSEQEVDRAIADVSAPFGSPEAFSDALSQQGLKVQDLKDRYKEQIAIHKLIDREVRYKITVSPTEVTNHYQNHMKEFELPMAAQVAAIMIRPSEDLSLDAAKELAEDLRKQIQGGADFYDIARRYSDGPNAKMGGRIGFLEKGKGLKEIDKVLFTLKEGEVSPVIKTSTGFNIFRVEAIRPAHQATLEEVKDKVQDKLMQEKGAARYKEWIEKLKQDAYISIK